MRRPARQNRGTFPNDRSELLMTMTHTRDPLVGHVVDGRYEITDRLARGGMATVYLATDTRLARTVAVKLMHEGLGGDGDFVSKFDREARAAARLSHPNVVAVFDQGLDGMRPYMVMEYVAGGTLRQLMSREGWLDPLRALTLIEPVLAALADAHEAGLIHRDVKPENVLITERGQLKVADFGLARAISEQTITANQGMLIGTVSYLPPELVLHGRAGPRSDVYSAGVVLFEMLTGSKPHTGDTPIQVAWAHVHNDIEPPSQRFETTWRQSRTGIPPYLDALVQAATRRRPEARPSDAKELLAAVRDARAALNRGVMDDPALTRRFRELGTSSKANVAPGVDQRAKESAAEADDAATEVVRQPVARPRRTPAPSSQRQRPPAPSPESDRRRRGAASSGRGTAGASARERDTRVLPPQLPRGLERTKAVPVAPALPATTRRAGSPSRPASSHRRELVERQRRRQRRGIAWLVLIILLTAAAVGMGWWLADGRFTAAPTVTGMPQEQATAAVRAAALTPHSVEEFSENVPAGSVIDSDPIAGSRLERQSDLALVISKGPERFGVPDVIGSSQEEATTALADSSLAAGELAEQWHSDVPAGVVIAADPAAGEALRRDSAVNLTVSKGPEPIRFNDFRGEPADEAISWLTERGFAVTEETAHSDTVKADQVIEQSPPGGEGHPGDEVQLVRSLGPELLDIPDVQAKSLDEATELLTDAGFEVTSKEGPNYLGLDYVASADPSEGRQAPRGSTITLILV